MKTRWVLIVLAAALMVFVSNAAFAQDNNTDNDKKWDNLHPMFNQHEHEVITKWWAEHRDKPPTGFRDEDKIPADWEPQLVPGFVLDNNWRARMHHLPGSLIFHLRRPPIPYIAYVIGGHIVLVNHTEWRVSDIINVNALPKS